MKVEQEVEEELNAHPLVEESKYYIITNPYEVQDLCAKILNCHPPPILGVDCEGLSKGRPLCLLQVSILS